MGQKDEERGVDGRRRMVKRRNSKRRRRRRERQRMREEMEVTRMWRKLHLSGWKWD